MNDIQRGGEQVALQPKRRYLVNHPLGLGFNNISPSHLPLFAGCTQTNGHISPAHPGLSDYNESAHRDLGLYARRRRIAVTITEGTD
jgi:hypothetical protein